MRNNTKESRCVVHALLCCCVVVLLCCCAHLGKAEHTSTSVNECVPSPAAAGGEREKEDRGERSEQGERRRRTTNE